jgi:glycine betaine/proline transport system substrate-binding protein
MWKSRKSVLYAGILGVISPVASVYADKGEVELAYVEWSSEVASTHVVQVVLEQLGYEVKLTPVSAAAMWQAVAIGDADGMVAAWLPTTHSHYLEKVKDKVEDLGPNMKGTRVGLVVPAYVTINSIEQLPAVAGKFNRKIIGIDPGAGMMSKTETVMESYGLDKYKLVEGSGATMTAALKNAIDTQSWIVVTGWTPHWKFSRWELKYLEDPKNIYGQEEYISTIVRQGLKEDLPEVYTVLDNFEWEPADMEAVMIWNQEEGAKPHETATRWVRENPDKTAEWLKGVK